MENDTSGRKEPIKLPPIKHIKLPYTVGEALGMTKDEIEDITNNGKRIPRLSEKLMEFAKQLTPEQAVTVNDFAREADLIEEQLKERKRTQTPST